MKSNEFYKFLKEDENVLYMYQYGSSVYGVHSEHSDIDILVIINGYFKIPEEYQKFAYEVEKIKDETIIHNLKYDNCDFIFYSLDEWFNMMLNNHIEFWECYNLSKKFVHKEYAKLIPELNKVLLRKEISSICSNAYVKAKKKMLQGDYYIGKKSLWHSLRVYLFGIQIIQYGKIIDFKEANKYYNDIVLNSCNDWKYYHKTYKKLYNNLHSEFKKLTESAWNQYIINKNIKKNETM